MTVHQHFLKSRIFLSGRGNYAHFHSATEP